MTNKIIEYADAIYTNGNIYTVDSAFSKASILAVKDGEIIYCGSDQNVISQITGAETKLTDLKGKTVIPGIMEAHLHFSVGRYILEPDFSGKTKEEILKMVKCEADKKKKGEWITGNLWNKDIWEDKSWPTKEDLDTVAPDHPVSLNGDGHSIWVNSKAFAVSGITEKTPDPPGGAFLKNENGELLGIAIDNASTLINKFIPEDTEETYHTTFKMIQEKLFSYGITSVMDAGTRLKKLNYMKRAYEKGLLKIRSYIFFGEIFKEDNEPIEEYLDLGGKAQIGLFDNRMTVRGAKFFTDGALASRGAWMLEPYKDMPGHYGTPRYSDEELYALVKRAVDHGFQITVHAIGSAGNRQILKVYDRVISENNLKDHRFRIEHFQIVAAEDIPYAVKLGVIPSMQAIHAVADKDIAEIRLDDEILKSSYAWRTIIDDGGIVLNSADFPYFNVNPFLGMYSAVSRMDENGQPEGGWHPEQRISREEALRSCTAWVAFAQFEEDIKGSLECGKLADFAVLDRDIMSCPLRDIRETKTLMTILGGEVVYDCISKN